MITDYASLQEQTAKLINREDMSEEIKLAIQIAENVVYRKLRVPEMEAYLELSTVSGQIVLPERFQGLRNIEIPGSVSNLDGVSLNTLDGKRSYGGVPRFYSIQGKNIILYPQPEDGAVVAMRAYVAPEALSDAENENAILTTYPELFLYGAASHMAAHLIDDMRVPLWKALFSEHLEASNDAARKIMQLSRPVPVPTAKTNLRYRRR